MNHRVQFCLIHADLAVGNGASALSSRATTQGPPKEGRDAKQRSTNVDDVTCSLRRRRDVYVNVVGYIVESRVCFVVQLRTTKIRVCASRWASRDGPQSRPCSSARGSRECISEEKTPGLLQSSGFPGKYQGAFEERKRVERPWASWWVDDPRRDWLRGCGLILAVGHRFALF